MGRRTERPYKAERPGETARHVEASGSGRTVDGPLVQQQFTFLSRETCSAERVRAGGDVSPSLRHPAERSPQCIDTPADVAGPASYSARESAGAGNSVAGGTGVSRERSTVASARAASAGEPAVTGRLEQDGRRGPRTISATTQKPHGPVARRRRADEPGPQDDPPWIVRH